MEIVYGVGLLLFFSLSQLIYKWLEESHLLWPLIGIVILILAGLTYERLQNMPVKPREADEAAEKQTCVPSCLRSVASLHRKSAFRM